MIIEKPRTRYTTVDLQPHFYAFTSLDNSRQSLRCIGQASAALHAFIHVLCTCICIALRTKHSRARSHCSRASRSSDTRTGPMVAAFLHASSGATGFLRAFLLAWRPEKHGGTGCRQRRSAPRFRQTPDRSFEPLPHPIRPCCQLHAAIMTVRDEACTPRNRASARPNHNLQKRQAVQARHLITRRGAVG